MSDNPALADGQHLARGAAANTLVLLAANFRAIFTFLIARFLGPVAFGQFGVAFAATDLISKAGMLGFDSSIVPLVAMRAAAGDAVSVRRLFRRAILSALAVSLVLAFAGLVLVAMMARRPEFARFEGFIRAFANGGSIMLLALPGIAVARISVGVSRGLLAMRNEFYSRGLTETWVTTAVFVIVIAFGIRDRAPAIAVVAGTTLAAVVAFALAARSIARIDPRSPETPSPLQSGRSTRAMVAYSLPTAGSGLLNVLVTEVDVLLLAAFVGRAPGVTLETLGVFVVAAQIAVGLRKVRQVFDPIFAPIVARRAASEQRERLRDTVAGPARWVLSAQLPLVGALILSGGAILSIYGEQYRQGALWLALLGLAHGANTFAGLVETLLMIERPGLNLVNAVATVTIQVAAGLVLIPRFGVTGAALAMCLGFGVQGILRFVEVRRVYGWSWPWRSLVRPGVAFALAFVPALAIRSVGTVAAEIAAGTMFVALYLAAWKWLGAEPADKEIWHTLLASRRAARPS